MISYSFPVTRWWKDISETTNAIFSETIASVCSTILRFLWDHTRRHFLRIFLSNYLRMVSRSNVLGSSKYLRVYISVVRFLALLMYKMTISCVGRSISRPIYYLIIKITIIQLKSTYFILLLTFYGTHVRKDFFLKLTGRNSLFNNTYIIKNKIRPWRKALKNGQ